MAIWAALITFGTAAYAADEQKKAGKDQRAGLLDSIASNEAFADQVRADYAPYRETGSEAVFDLAELLGLAGFRSKEERELTMMKAPDRADYAIAGYGPNKSKTQTFKDRTLKATEAVLEPFGHGPIGKIGGSNKSKKMRAAAARDAEFQRQQAEANARFDADLAAYEKRQAELTGIVAEQERAGFDPMKKVRATPGYQFRMDQGQRALERTAAARGDLQSGNTLKAVAEYGQEFASNEYTNAVNRLATMAGLGANTTANQTSALSGTNVANMNLLSAIGQSRASNREAAASLYGNAALGIAGNMTYQNMLNTYTNKLTAQPK